MKGQKVSAAALCVASSFRLTSVMKAQAEKMTAQAKLDLKPHLDAVQTRFDDAKAKLDQVAATGDDKWDEVVKAVDHGWAELKSAAEGALDAMKQEKPD